MTCYEIVMTTTYFWPIKVSVSHALKTLQKLLKFRTKSINTNLVLFAVKPLHHLLSSFGIFRSETAHFHTFFSPPERIVTWSLLQRRPMDLLSPCSRAISKLFSTASASVITFILKAILYEERWALGMMIKGNSDERDTRSTDTLKRLTEIVVVVDLLSCGSIYTRRWINWYSYLLIGSPFFFCVYCNSLGFVFSESISYVFREVRWLKWPLSYNK